MSNTTYDNDELYYDDTHDDLHVSTPKYDQALIDDIFGISDDEDDFVDVTVHPEVPTPPDTIIDTAYDPPLINSPVLRKSCRNHQLGEWDKKYVGNLFYNHTHLYKMTVNKGINKLGVIAVDSITSEFKQMCDKNVWEDVTYESLTPQQQRTIIPRSMFLKVKYTADGMAGGHL